MWIEERESEWVIRTGRKTPFAKKKRERQSASIDMSVRRGAPYTIDAQPSDVTEVDLLCICASPSELRGLLFALEREGRRLQIGAAVATPACVRVRLPSPSCDAPSPAVPSLPCPSLTPLAAELRCLLRDEAAGARPLPAPPAPAAAQQGARSAALGTAALPALSARRPRTPVSTF